MLDPQSLSPIAMLAEHPPMLTVVIDTEEEFDWNAPFSRTNTRVNHIKHQSRAHRLFERWRVKPIYLCDYPVVTQDGGRAPLRELLADGLCEIGAHLHPWVNPPYDEVPSARNSYPGNLPPALEREKLVRLTGAIEDAFSLRPNVYRAGRYGVGPTTAAILEELGYDIDVSVVPGTDFRGELGPDFTQRGPHPYWFGRERRLLELPLTVWWTGLLAASGATLHAASNAPVPKRLRVPGILARLGLLERIRLSPEGISFEEMRRLVLALRSAGVCFFSLTYHSPSLVPGNTPYVRNASELERFLDTIDRFLGFFMGELGGLPTTPNAILDLLIRRDGAPAIAAA